MSVITPTPPAPPTTPPPPPPAPQPRSNTALRIGAVITGLLIIGAALNLFSLTAGRDTVTSHYAFPSATSVLVLDTESADVRVVAGDTGRLTVDRHASTAHGHALAAPHLSGSTLRLPSDCYGSALGLLIFCSVSYTVHVPADLDLTVRTGSGEIDVEAITAAGLVVKAGSGDLTLTDVTAQRASATTGSGEVSATGLLCPQTVVDTGSGDVDLEFGQAPGSLTASTGSGELSVLVPRDSTTYTVHQHTGSGTYTNHLLSSDQAPADPGGHVLTVSTGSGDLTLTYSG